MTSETSNIFVSPKLISVDNVTMTVDTIDKLFGNSNIASYNLCFVVSILLFS